MKIKKLSVLIGAIPFTIAVLLVTIAALPPGAAAILGNKTSSAIMRVMPEGWAFFTRSPLDENPNAYVAGSMGAPESLIQLPNTRAENLFGLSRNGRSQGVEVAGLAGQVNEDDWIECDRTLTIEECLRHVRAESDEPMSIDNAVPGPVLCEKMILTNEVAVPFAYRNLTTERTKIVRATLVDASCEEG